jgi:hypothetical protein
VFNYQRGDFVPVQWQAAGGVLSVLNIKEHDLDLPVLLFDVTSTGSGGLRARLGGLADIAGNIKMDFDADAPPYLPVPFIIGGVSGIALFGVSPVRAIQCPLIVEKLHFMSGVESEVKWDTSMKANSRVGALVFPAL